VNQSIGDYGAEDVALKHREIVVCFPDGATQVISSYKAFTLALGSVCFYSEWVRELRSPAEQPLGRYMTLTSPGVEGRNECSY
jgi:hypothetical protein